MVGCEILTSMAVVGGGGVSNVGDDTYKVGVYPL